MACISIYKYYEHGQVPDISNGTASRFDCFFRGVIWDIDQRYPQILFEDIRSRINAILTLPLLKEIEKITLKLMLQCTTDYLWYVKQNNRLNTIQLCMFYDICFVYVRSKEFAGVYDNDKRSIISQENEQYLPDILGNKQHIEYLMKEKDYTTQGYSKSLVNGLDQWLKVFDACQPILRANARESVSFYTKSVLNQLCEICPERAWQVYLGRRENHEYREVYFDILSWGFPELVKSLGSCQLMVNCVVQCIKQLIVPIAQTIKAGKRPQSICPIAIISGDMYRPTAAPSEEIIKEFLG